MPARLKTNVFQFFERFIDEERPVLLGLSGGVDSMTLLHLLKDYKNLRFGAAHVDHRWRPESEEEARSLKELVENMGVPFHLLTLSPDSTKGNLEDACRRARYRFFKELCNQYGYQGVIVGHQADDQVETVLKRFFEGAAIDRLEGMKAKSDIDGVTVFRPLLQVEKIDATRFLEERGASAFDDPTNRNCQYLRARMREDLIPSISKKFGKNIVPAVRALSGEAAELGDFLDELINPYLSHAVVGPFGLYLDLSTEMPVQPYILKYLVRSSCRKMGVTLSKDQQNAVCTHLLEGSANKRVENRENVVHVDRKRLFVLPIKLPSLPVQQEDAKGAFTYGSWRVTVMPVATPEAVASSWVDVWKGHVSINLPEGDYRIGPPNSTMSKRWTNQKIPAFLRNAVPVIYGDGVIVHEFLSGQTTTPKTDKLLNITLVQI